MNEKTPRQIGEEAKKLRIMSHEMFSRRENAQDGIERSISNAKKWDKIARSLETENTDENAEEIAERRRIRDIVLHSLTAHVLEQALVEDDELIHEAEVKQHLEENSAGYHDLAVAEAALDGVKINVSQAESNNGSVADIATAQVMAKLGDLSETNAAGLRVMTMKAIEADSIHKNDDEIIIEFGSRGLDTAYSPATTLDAHRNALSGISRKMVSRKIGGYDENVHILPTIVSEISVHQDRADSKYSNVEEVTNTLRNTKR